MNRKLSWGLAALIVLIGSIGFVFYRQYVDIHLQKKDVAKYEKFLKEYNKKKQRPKVSSELVRDNRSQYTGEHTYQAYEKYLTDAFQNIKRNEFGLPLSRLPAGPPFFRNPEEQDKANRLWNKLSAEFDASCIAAEIRIDARYAAPEYTGELTYEAYHNYLDERKKSKGEK